ncbi:MAG TPA: TPM domain-containing protein [Gemmatimonadaceae bacterium]|nr:TPM domain-containing protein [Gemmatimonadaceae bacterium]
MRSLTTRLRRVRKTTIALASLLLLIGMRALHDGRARERIFSAGRILLPSHHVDDRAKVLSFWDRARFEQYLTRVQDESDVDMRLVFADDLHGATIEQFAAAEAEAMRMGAEGREARGVLFAYDVRGKQLRIEVGYGLEKYFPDAFVGFLITENARDFFAAEDARTGVFLTTRILQSRIRDAALGGDFDPRPLEILKERSHVSGGAGATAATPLGASAAFVGERFSPKRHRYFGPQPSPEDAFERYLEWLAAGAGDPDVSLFTPETQLFLADYTMTRGYVAYMLMQISGKTYRVERREDLAMLYFTSTPFASPCFFRQTRAGWQMDITAEMHNTAELVGLPYTWSFVDGGDDFANEFVTEATPVGPNGVLRWRDGDNRPLPMRD